MHLETKIKLNVQDFRNMIKDSDDKINMPKYETLCEIKRLSLRKLMGKVERSKHDIIEITFDQDRLNKM